MFNGLYLVFIAIGSVIIGIALGAKLRHMRERKKMGQGRE